MKDIHENRIGSRPKTVGSLQKYMLGVALGALIVQFQQPALAQTKIEQMIVTAQKRSQEIQTVPASISAFSGDMLEERQIKTVEDLTYSTPNLSWQMAGAVVQLSIRGISPDGSSPYMDPAVALHVDGIYQPRSAGVLGLVMSDLESVEILRGPQGTLYGRNANAGIVNMNTKRPTDTFEGSATIFGGSYARYGARGYVSGPITDKISARVSALVDRNHGYGRNLHTGKRLFGEWTHGARLAITAKPIEDITLNISATHSRTHNTQPFSNTSPPAGPNYASLVAAGADTRYTLEPYKTYNTSEPNYNYRYNLLVATIEWDITPDVSLKSITGQQYFRADSVNDSDGMPVEYIPNKGFTRSHTFSQEINLSARLFDRVDAVAGLYYLRDDFRFGYDAYVQGNLTYNPANPRQIHNEFNQQLSSSRAAFVDLTVNVTDNLRLLAGGRRTLDERRTVMTALSYFPATGVTTPLTCINRRLPDLNYSSTTGKIGVQYDITPDIMGYVVWQNGFKTGGMNPSVCGNSYLPERVYSWEAGVKSSLFDNSLILNITGFTYRYNNMQLSRTLGGFTQVDNAATAKLKGLEISAQALLTENLRADLGIGILDSKYGPLFAQNGAVPGSPLVNLTGFQLPRAPKTTLNFGLEYTMRIGDFGELTSRGEVNYVSKNYFTAFNEAIAKQDAFATVNAIFTLVPDDCPYSFRAFVKNLTDEAYYSGIATSGILAYGRGTWSPPRTFGIEATAKF